jgi:hypothetical protein
LLPDEGSGFSSRNVALSPPFFGTGDGQGKKSSRFNYNLSSSEYFRSENQRKDESKRKIFIGKTEIKITEQERGCMNIYSFLLL